MQVAGDPVAVGEDVELALGAVLLPQLERERGLLGERGQQRHLAGVERRPPVLPQRDQNTDHHVVGVERHGDGRSVRRQTRDRSADLPAIPPARPCGSPRPHAEAGRARRDGGGRAPRSRTGRGPRSRRRAGRAPAPGRVASDVVSSSVRWAISPSASSSLAPDSSSFRISADASSHCCRSRPCSNRSALCTAIPAAAARASTRISSSAVNSPAAVLLGQVQVAEHRVADPDRAPRGRCASAGGAAGSRPTRRACSGRPAATGARRG